MKRNKTACFFGVFFALVVSIGAFGQSRSDKKTIALVEYFLKTPIATLDPSLVPQFVAIDPETLPKKLRRKYKAKRLELYALKKIADGQKKGFVRIPATDPDCSVAPKASDFDVRELLSAGFLEISRDDLLCLERETHCAKSDMMCEFTLKVLEFKKGKKTRERYFLFNKDVLEEIVEVKCHNPKAGGNTNFFSEKPTPLCSH